MCWRLPALVLMVVVRPGVFHDESRWLDVALVAYVGIVAAAIVPLVAGHPPRIVSRYPPRLDSDVSTRRHPRGRRPRACVPSRSTRQRQRFRSFCRSRCCCSSGVARAPLFARGGVRLCARAIAGLGLVLAGIGMAQHATAPHLLYWMFPTRSATPFGPFMKPQRFFATWLVMALPVTTGYLIARLQSRRSHTGPGARDGRRLLTTPAMWLTTAVGFHVGGARRRTVAIRIGRGGGRPSDSLWALSSRRMKGRGRGWLLAGFLAVGAIAAAYANTNAISGTSQRDAESWARRTQRHSGGKRGR